MGMKAKKRCNLEGCSAFAYLVAWDGIEPPTQGFSILCSTD